MSELDEVLRQYNAISSKHWLNAKKLEIKDILIKAYAEDYKTFKKNLDAL